jgi:hypothetical protein
MNTIRRILDWRRHPATQPVRAETCQYCGDSFETTDSADDPWDRIGFACPACYGAYLLLEAELVTAEARQIAGAAPWLTSAPQWEISVSKRANDRQIVIQAVQQLSSEMKTVPPAAARIFTKRYSVFEPWTPSLYASKPEAVAAIGDKVHKSISGTTYGGAQFSISLHPSSKVLLLNDTFGDNKNPHRESQTCYFIDHKNSVHSLYIYHR